MVTELRVLSAKIEREQMAAVTHPFEQMRYIIVKMLNMISYLQQNGNLPPVEQETVRYLLLEIGWLLTNLAYLPGNITEALVRNEDMYEEHPSNGMLFLASQALAQNPTDLQLID